MYCESESNDAIQFFLTPFLRRARIRGDCGQRNDKKLELSEFSAKTD